MPFRHALFRTDPGLTRRPPDKLEKYFRLEDYIARNMKILSDRWMFISRQIYTDLGRCIELTAVEGSGAPSIFPEGGDATATATAETYRLDG